MSEFGIRGLAFTPPTVGRISIGLTTDKNGKSLPVKDDQITITGQLQVKHQWIKHPIDEVLRKKQYAEVNNVDVNTVKHLDLVNQKLRTIPVTMLFDDPNLNLRAEHTCFDKNSRVHCRGNGITAKRMDDETGRAIEVECNPHNCETAVKYRCKPYTRFNVQIEGQEDEFSTFIYRTAGWNGLRALQTKLVYFASLANGKLAGMPLDLVMRAKSTAQSFGTTFYYLDLELRKGVNIIQAVKIANQKHKEWEDGGVSRTAFEEAARQGVLNGMFEDSPEEIQYVADEFYPELSDEDLENAVANVRSLLDQDKGAVPSNSLEQDSVPFADGEVAFGDIPLESAKA